MRAQLAALAHHFARRREAILAAWRLAIDMDPELNSAAKSTRNQFVDHIPDVLDAFESRLRAQDPEEKAEARTDQKEWAAEHGMHRWQQGYQLIETMREWGHLHLCLLAELERHCKQHLGAESEIPAIARRELARLASDGVCASAARYAQLQQSEAASRLYDLESALGELKALEVERAESWRQAAHDLRGNAHVIASASAVLTREDVSEIKRAQISTALSAASTSLNKLLSDLLDQARLEAGHERRKLKEFDAAKLIKEFCETARTLAADRNLFLKCEGPAELIVEGDPTKVQRDSAEPPVQRAEGDPVGRDSRDVGVGRNPGRCESLGVVRPGHRSRLQLGSNPHKEGAARGDRSCPGCRAARRGERPLLPFR